MNPTVHLHIGLPKTGTSYLQSVLAGSGPALLDAGLALLPTGRNTAFQVMLDLREELRHDLDRPESFGAVDRLDAEVAALRTPRALLSQELLCLASAEQVRRLLGALPDREVHVVVTVRDLATLLPSLWQQQVKARGTMPFDSFLDMVQRGCDDASRAPRGYDLLGVLAQWRRHLPAERIHVVTVPRPGAPSDLLLARFCQVVDLDPAVLDTALVESNRSLGRVQAELLRRVNVALGDRLPHARAGYRGQGKRFLAETILIEQPGAPPRLPARARPWVEERSARLVDELAGAGFHVVGDLEELRPRADAFGGDDGEVGDPAVAEAAVMALADILVERATDRGRLRREVRRHRERVRQLESGRWLPRLRRLRPPGRRPSG